MRRKMPNQIQTLSHAYMKLNYHQFCEIINEGREDSWTEEKWDAWIRFNQAAAKLGTLLDKLMAVD